MLNFGFDSGTPGAEFYVARGNYHGFVVHFSGVIVDGGGRLCAEVAGFHIEIERGDAVFTVHAGELYAVLDALGAVGFHWLNCRPFVSGIGGALVGQRR